MTDRPMHQGDNFRKLTALYAEGERLIEEGELERAIATFTEGLGIDDHFRQRYITMYAQRAFALQRLGRLEEAIADYTAALEMEAELNHAQYFFHRGMCFQGLEGKASAALDDFSRSIALYDGHPGPFHLRGRLYANVFERYADAIADLDKLLAMRPEPEGYQLRGFSKIMLKDYAGGLADVERANELAPNAYCDYLAACALAALGRKAELFERIERTLRVDGSYAASFASDDELVPYREDRRFKELLAKTARGLS